MDVDRRTVTELTIGALVLLTFTAAAYVVSGEFAAPRNGTNASVPPTIEPTGGLALVGVIGGFVLLVAVAGLYIYSQDFDDE